MFRNKTLLENFVVRDDYNRLMREDRRREF